MPPIDGSTDAASAAQAQDAATGLISTTVHSTDANAIAASIGNEASDALLHGPQNDAASLAITTERPLTELEKLANEHAQRGSETPVYDALLEKVAGMLADGMAPLVTRFDAAEKLLADHAGMIETVSGLVEHICDKSGDLEAKLGEIGKTVEALAPLSPDDAQLLKDAVALAEDIKAALPRLAALELKIRHFF